MPELRVIQRFLAPIPAGHPNPVLCLPICFPRWIIGYASPMEKLRRLREHPLRDAALGFPRQSMANRTVLFVSIRAGEVSRLIYRHGRGIRVRIFAYPSVQCAMGEFLL